MKINSPQRNKVCPQCLQHSCCRRGFTLVETLVAISIFTMSLLGTMSVLGSSIANTNYAKQKVVATYLAQEGIEYVRNMRDNAVLYLTAPTAPTPPVRTWSLFKSSFLPPSPSSTFYPVSSDFPGYTRTISADTTNFGTTDEVKITSTVTWTQGSGPHSITFSENLFNWVE